MSFENPFAIFVAFPLCALIVLLYILRMRRREVRVPATFLWPAHTEEVRANALFQRLRPNLLLLLQLLAVLAASIALARPVLRQTGLLGKSTVIVLDTSASMTATDVRPSRFDAALRRAREAISSARPGDRIALITAGPLPEVAFALGDDTPRQLVALGSIRPTEAAGDMGEALRLAAALVGDQEGSRILVLSDGVFPPVTDFAGGSAVLAFESFGTASDNLGIEALSTAEAPQGRLGFFSVRNYGDSANDGSLTLYADGRVLDSWQTGKIGPNDSWSRTLAVPADARVLEARLGEGDALKADNYAVHVAAAGARLRVLLISPGNPFLERALALDPRVTLDRAASVPPDEAGAPGGGKYDVVVFDGVPEVPVRARGVLSFGAPTATSPAIGGGDARRPTILPAEAHPLLKGLSLDGTYVDRQFRFRPAAGADVIAESSAGPLIVARAQPDRRQILIGFSILDSDFPLQISFPIFIANALDYLSRNELGEELSLRAGARVVIASGSDGNLTAPDGGQRTLPLREGRLIVPGLTAVGKHTLKSGGKTRRLYVSLGTPTESNLAPQTRLTVGSGTAQTVARPSRFADFWRPFALLLLGVLVGEWWLFARRS